MRILVYKDNLSTGRGADKAVRNFAAGLKERGHDVALMEKTRFAQWLAGEDGYRRFDVIVATGPNEIVDIDEAGYFNRCGRARVVLQLHLAPRGFFKWKHPIRNWRIRSAFRKADVVQVLCKSYEAEFLKIAPQANIVTIGNYTEVDTGGMESTCENPIVLYPAAAFTHVKNQGLLIRAFARLAVEFPEWRLRLLGRNDTRNGDRCRRLAQRLGIQDKVEFSGFSSNLAIEYANAAFIAFPSILEGFPLALLEAAKFGLCSVAHSGLPGVTDIVQNGETGIVAEQSVEAYAEELRKLMADAGLRKRMGERAREFCAEHYSREKILDQWELRLQKIVLVEADGVVGESAHNRGYQIGIYKDTLSNHRGADVAVLALAEGLRERFDISRVEHADRVEHCNVAVFEKKDFEERIKEHWDIVISTGTNELLDLHSYFKNNFTRSTRSTRLLFPWPVIQQFHTNPKSQFKWKHPLRNWKIRRVLKCVSAIQVLRKEFVSQVAGYGIPVHVIGNWSRFGEMKNDGAMGEKPVGDASASSRKDGLLHPPTPTQDSSFSAHTIIYPAAFAKGKNQKLLIKAFVKVLAKFPEWKLRLLGKAEGRYADECRELASKLGNGRIEFAGHCADIAVEYENCAFIAFPSLDEGFGLVIADAAAFAKPCVMIKDWIGTVKLEDGTGDAEGGGIVTEPTVEAYANGLRRLMADAWLRKRMGERAREFCAEHYSREKILDQWEDLLRNMSH